MDVDFSGTAVTTQDSGWYFAEVDIANYIPTNANLISAEPSANWDGNVFYSTYGHKVLVRSSASKTLGTNRKVRLTYYIP